MEIKETPWLTPESVSMLEKLIKGNPGLKILEFGCGGSTIWFSRKLKFPKARLVSVEHDKEWYEAIKTRVPADVDLRYAPRPYANVCDEFPDESFDIVMVDGRDRIACTAKAMRLVKRGGIFILDNADRSIYSAIHNVLLKGWPYQSTPTNEEERLQAACACTDFWHRPMERMQANVADDKLVSCGEAAFRQGDLEKAETLGRLAIEKNACVADALNLLAVICYSRKEVYDAAGLLEAGLKFEPQNQNVTRNLQIAYTFLSDSYQLKNLRTYRRGHEATEAWLPFITGRINQASHDQNELLKIAGQLAERWREGNAIELLNMMLSQDPQNAPVHHQMGIIYFSLAGYQQTGLDYLEAAHRLAPQDPEIKQDLAAAYSCLGRQADAQALVAEKQCVSHRDPRFDALMPSVFPVEVTAVCNLKCPECATGAGLRDGSKRFLSLDEFKHIAEKIRPYAKETLLHVWGEPMLNPDIFEMIRIASEFSRVNISTNALPLTDKKAEKLITSGVKDLIVSIDGVTQETYSKYRVGGDVEKAKKALRALAKYNKKHNAGVRIIPQFVVFKHNQHEMAEFEAFCRSLGLLPSFKAPYMREGSQLENPDMVQFHRPEYPDRASQCRAISECSAPRQDFTILIDGSVVLCCQDYDGSTKVGNIFEQSVMEIWNGERCRNLRWDVVSGNPPKFCTHGCLSYLCTENRAECAQRAGGPQAAAVAPPTGQQFESVERTQEETLDWLRAVTNRINQACGNPDKLIEIATELAEGGQDDTAEELARMVINQNPDHADAFNLLGCIYFQRGSSRDALRYFESARRLDPNNLDTAKNMVAVHTHMGQYEKAVALCQEMLKICPNDPEIPAIIGELLEIIKSRVVGALEALDNGEETVAFQPTDSIRPDESLPTDTGTHSCMFIDTYYGAFLNSHYTRHPELANATYEEQKQSLLSEFFGDSDFYSNGLRAAGWNADNVIVNCPPLLEAWARENDFSGSHFDLVVEMVRRTRPDVIYIQDLVSLPVRALCDAIRPYTKLIAGQIATPMTPNTDVTALDVIFTSLPHYAERFREQGVTAYWQPLAFEPRILERLGKDDKHYDVTFVGGISNLHIAGNQQLEMLANSVPLEIWGYGSENLPGNSVLRSHHHGEAWGLDMFSLMKQSKITFNRHGEIAENYANNMRLFEATGCGALLMTDYKDNLNELFEVGKEVIAFRTPEECVALTKYYVEHPEEAEQIARAGQARTLRDHTYEKRMQQTASILERHLRYRNEAPYYASVDTRGTSCGHTAISPNDVTENMVTAWQSEDIPLRQRKLAQESLAEMYKGRTPAVYEALASAMRPYVRPGTSVLEIGCASGYYSEVLDYLLNTPIDYTGVDYSEPLIEMARDYYPEADFVVTDGANMPFEDGRFEIAISSCILLHVPNYKEHIKETARVAGRVVVAHRTPICKTRPTQYMKKLAYGVETVELMFNESEFISEFEANGLRLISSIDEYANPQRDHYAVTYVFEKV